MSAADAIQKELIKESKEIKRGTVGFIWGKKKKHSQRSAKER